MSKRIKPRVKQGYSQPLKQYNDSTCTQTCLAMITGCSVEEVVKWFDNDGPLFGTDAILFLIHHGIFPAIFFGVRDWKSEHMKLSIRDRLAVDLDIEGRPALLTVKSERFVEKLHSVFFDGEYVYDPSPLAPVRRGIETYQITEYWPLMMTETQLNRIKTLREGGHLT